MHEGVGDVAAIGARRQLPVKRSRSSSRKDPNLSAEEVIAHRRKHLTGWQVPKQVEFRFLPDCRAPTSACDPAPRLGRRGVVAVPQSLQKGWPCQPSAHPCSSSPARTLVIAQCRVAG